MIKDSLLTQEGADKQDIRKNLTQVKPKSERLKSLDVYRGFTMLGMMASDFAFKEGGIPFLLHADWSGVTVVDFVFPAFMFIMGSAIPLAINQKRPLRIKHVARVFLIWLIGFALNCFEQKCDFSEIRIQGILQRLAPCYGIVLLVHWASDYFKNMKRNIICAIIMVLMLILYCVLMLTWSNESIGCPQSQNLGPYCNFAGYLDRLVFGQAHIYELTDPEGIVSTITSAFSTYMGYLSTLLILKFQSQPKKIVKYMLAFALINLIPVYPLVLLMPLCKKLYSISYLFLTTSVSMTFLTFFYVLVDYLPKMRPRAKAIVQKVTRPLLWNGLNPMAVFIFLQLLCAIMENYIIIDGEDFRYLFYHNVFLSWLPPFPATGLFDLFFILLLTSFAGILYHKKLFLRI